jgi:hypothetical protein
MWFQYGLLWFLSMISYLCAVLSHIYRHWSDQQHTTDVVVCDYWELDIKDIGVSVLISLFLLMLFSLLNHLLWKKCFYMLWTALQRGPHSKKFSALPAANWLKQNLQPSSYLQMIVALPTLLMRGSQNHQFGSFHILDPQNLWDKFLLFERFEFWGNLFYSNRYLIQCMITCVIIIIVIEHNKISIICHIHYWNIFRVYNYERNSSCHQGTHRWLYYN